MKYSFKEFTTNQLIKIMKDKTTSLYHNGHYVGCVSILHADCLTIKFCEGYKNESLLLTIGDGKAIITLCFDEIEA